MIKMPYVGQLSMPLNWRNEQSGLLAAAMTRFIRFVSGAENAVIGIDELELVRAYLAYFLRAPCWIWHDIDGDGMTGPGAGRRRMGRVLDAVRAARSPRELYAAAVRAQDWGIDPFL